MGLRHCAIEALGQADSAVCRHPFGDGLPVKRRELILARAARKTVRLLAETRGFQHFGQKTRLQPLCHFARRRWRQRGVPGGIVWADW